MLLITLIAWTVHWHTFSRPELGLDGALSVDLARSSLADMLNFNARDVHPPLFYALLNGWLTLSGLHYFTAKYLAIAGSLPALPLLYQIGRRLLPRGAALASAALLAVAPASLFLAPTVRDFGLGLTLSLATVSVALDLSRRGGDNRASARARWLALAVLTAAALLTWYFHLFFFVAEAILLFWYHRRLVAAHIAQAIGAFVAAPWYVYVIPHITRKLSNGVTTFGSAPRLPSGTDVLSGLSRAVLGQSGGIFTALALAGWLAALSIGLFFELSERTRSDTRQAANGANLERRTGRFALVALLLGVAEVAVATLRWSDVGSLQRYILPLLPFVSLFQARALIARHVFGRGLAGAGILVAVAAQVIWFRGLVTSPPIDWSHDAALAYVAAHAQPGDGIVFNDRARRGRYLLDRGPLPAWVIHSAGQRYLADSPEQAAHVAAQATAAARRLWLVQLTPSTDFAQRALAADAFGLPSTNVGGSDVQLFLTQIPDHVVTPNVALGSVIRLRSARFAATAQPGGALAVELDWVDLQRTPLSYTVFVHVKNSKGDTVAQHDSPPVLGFSLTNTWQPGQVVTDRFAIPLPSALPLGTYDLHVGLYLGPQRLTLPGGANLIDIGNIAVAQ